MKRDRVREIVWLLTLLLAATCLRLAFLLGPVGRLLRSDEATNGVIALDILRGRPIPFFQYGDEYGGGQVVEALLMAPLFRWFGPSEFLLKAVPAAGSIVFLGVFYAALRRLFSFSAALTATGLLAFSAPFVSCSFMVYGNNPTGIACWLGLLLAFGSNRHSCPGAWPLLLSGFFLGLGYYLHPSAIFIALGALVFLATSRHRLLWAQPRQFPVWLFGALLGTTPLLLHHARLSRSDQPRTTLSLTSAVADPRLVLEHLRGFLSHDLPAFFSADVYDFGPSISPWTWATATMAFLLAVIGVAAAGRPLRGWTACWRERRCWQPDPAGWAWVWLGFVALFTALYSLHPLSGLAARYLIPVLAFLFLLVAWGVQALGRRRLALGLSAAILFQGLQIPLLVEFAHRRTTQEWGIIVNADDLRRVREFLEERGYRDVVAPYEIKWKLLFLSNGRIRASASPFGFDRESTIDAEVLRRINAGEAPLVIVLDRELRYPQIGQLVNPAQAFRPEEFFGNLERQGVTYETTVIGDFVVFHRFSTPFRLVPAPPRPAAPAGGRQEVPPAPARS